MGDINVTKDPTNKSLTVERVFDAPRTIVWQAWTDPARLAEWWGPRGWQTEIKQFDFRPGGIWLYCMTCLDPDQGDFFEQESWGRATYLEIDAPNRFTYKDEFAAAGGNALPDMPAMTITMEFKPVEGDTDKTLVASRAVFDSAEDYEKVLAMGMVEGLTQTWNRLAEELAAAD